MPSAKTKASLQEMVSGKKFQISKTPIYVCLTLFICYVAAPRPKCEPSSRDNLPHLMLITAFLSIIELKFTENLVIIPFSGVATHFLVLIDTSSSPTKF